MISFQVNDMTCGHCVSTLRLALQDRDPAARVQFDLAAQRVDIEPGTADADGLRDAILAAGYTPVPTGSPAVAASGGAAPEHQGCCCR